jgi:superfamily II DNA or RNA helicase
MTTFTELFDQLNPDDNVRGKQFERICKWYLEHDPFYADQLTRVWLWKDWPGRWYPKKEAGIDLVAQHRDGTLWAIQAKAYGQAYSVTKHDVDKFLSESNRKDDTTGRPLFSYRLLLATTRKQLGSTARNTVNAQAIPVGYRGRTELDAVEINWPASPSDLRARRLPPKKPTGHWAYQGEAMNKVVNGFQRADRGKLIMACGTGKTLTALFIREKMAAQRTLVLMPSLQLMKQTIGEWTRNKTADFNFLPVCSDETVSKDDVDMPVSSTSDLGLPVKTDPEEIAAFLRRRSGPLVVFATYQSSPQIAKAFKLGRVPAFDLAIADEAHRCAASHSSEFATILSNEKIKAHRRLFMTATPRIYSAHVRKAAKEAGYEFASMDDEENFGKVFHRLSFHEAIERNLLTDYRVAIIGVDNATYRDWAENGWFITIDGKEVKDARSVAGQIGLAKAMCEYGLHRVITFHRLVKGAKEFKVSFPDVIDWMPIRQRPEGTLWTDYVDGTMSAWERQRRLQRLGDVSDGEHAVISNARCLTEGVDVPTLDGVAFIDPKRSEIDIAQAVGRAIRLADEKTIGTIVIPVFIDTDEPNPDIILDDSAFKPVWDVLLALRAHDEDLAQQLDDLRRMLGRLRGGGRGSLRLPPKVEVVDIPDVCGVDFASAFRVRLVEETTASWEFWYGLLQDYVATKGHARVAAAYKTPDGYRIGSWVNKQRTNYQDGILAADRISRLESIHPTWSWDARSDRWEEGFAQLTRYAKENGHAQVPDDYRTDDGYVLGKWVGNQRGLYSKGKLAEDRVRRLQKLDPTWTWNTVTDKWKASFDQLSAYVNENGHARVPKDYKTADGVSLGWWVMIQRANFRKGKLDAELQDRLEGLHPTWSWDPRTDQLEEAFANLCEFVKENGHARVPRNYKSTNGFALGAWAQNQRAKYNKGRLEADLQRRLEDFHPTWSWDPHTDRWEEGFRQLCAYIDQHGNTRVRQSYKAPDGYPLGSWVGNQREFYRKGTLVADRRKRLESAHPTWTWDPMAARWEEAFDHLCAYVDHHGHALVPQRYTAIDGYALGTWVANQRQAKRRGDLSLDRENRLAKLNGWRWDPYADYWEEGFGRLLDYINRRGDARIAKSYSVDGYQLGDWVARQRSEHFKGVLDPDREQRLTSLVGWTWDPRGDQWEEGFRRLLDYINRRGDARIAKSYSVDGYNLGAWVRKQRRRHAEGTLEADRESRLQDLPGWTWDSFADRWEAGLSQLMRYVERRGHARVPATYTVDGYQLGTWVSWQRRKHAEGTLDADRESRLQKVRGWTWKARPST